MTNQNKKELDKLITRFAFSDMLKKNIITEFQINLYCKQLLDLHNGYNWCLELLQINLENGEGLEPLELMDKLNDLCNPKTKNEANYEFCKYIPTLPEHFFPEYKIEELEKVCEGEKWEKAKKNIRTLCLALQMGEKILKNVYGMRFLGGCPWMPRVEFLDGGKIKNDDNYQYNERYLKFLASLDKNKGTWFKKPGW